MSLRQSMFMPTEYRKCNTDCNRHCNEKYHHTSDMDTFAERVRGRRQDLHLTQKDLARRSGLSQTTISDIERGRNDGSREILSLAKALGCDPQWLKDGRGQICRGDTPRDESVLKEEFLALTQEEINHVRLLRELDSEGRRDIQKAVKEKKQLKDMREQLANSVQKTGS